MYYICGCTCYSAHVKVREQLEGVSSFLLQCGSLGSTLGCRVWWSGKCLYLLSHLAGPNNPASTKKWHLPVPSCPLALVLLQGQGSKRDCENITETSVREAEPTLLIRPEDIVPKEPGSSEETLRVLLRPSDKVSNHYKTTSSEISATVGAVPSICEHVTFFCQVK